MSNIDETFPKQYDPSAHEDAIYERWEKSGLFKPEKQENTNGTYANILPPPNANASLHIGHASGYTVMDLMGRVERMQGKKTLLLPGKDHAGIMTQIVFERELEKTNETRESIGREEFFKRCYDFSINNANYMRDQEKKLGLAADWDREKFTLDPKISETVLQTFKNMYDEGLIYRGDRIVNWDPVAKTSLSDLEVKYVQEKTKFYYFKYGPVVIGTARPETKFLDKIIVVHPDDKRYQKYFGKKIMVPWINGEVEATFIADEAADPNFGSGAMTITPAHSFEDFDIAKKHGIDVVQIINEDGNFTDAVGPEFAGKNARESREEIVKILEEKGLVDHIDEDYEHNLSVSERSGAAVEPLISKQWFVNVDHEKFSLKKASKEAVASGAIKLYPDRFKKIFLAWMDDLHDWCISRQLWWGHQIPAYYCEECGNDNPIVATEAPKKCPTCGGKKLMQDPDTLDTWFSSGQWVYTTLGFEWGKKDSTDMKEFYPSDLMVMGRDILFFWSARMVMMSLYANREKKKLEDRVPFRRVYYTGLVRDKYGQKMSKSKGNGIDPLEMTKKYGTDALRLAMLSNITAGNDFRMYEERIESYRNFANKLWNIARFIELRKESQEKTDTPDETLADQWILSRLQQVIDENTRDLDLDKLDVASPSSRMYQFLWDDFADWYLEVKKIEDPEGNQNDVLTQVLETSLRMLHPYIPFVTEAIWERTGHDSLLMAESWPEASEKLQNKKAEKDFAALREAITAIRNVRGDYQIAPKESLDIAVPNDALFDENQHLIKKMTNSNIVEEQRKGMISRAIGKKQLYIDLSGKIDVAKELAKAKKELARLEALIGGLEKKLGNKQFVSKAPEEIIQKEKDKLETQQAKLETEKSRIFELESL